MSKNVSITVIHKLKFNNIIKCCLPWQDIQMFTSSNFNIKWLIFYNWAIFLAMENNFLKILLISSWKKRRFFFSYVSLFLLFSWRKYCSFDFTIKIWDYYSHMITQLKYENIFLLLWCILIWSVLIWSVLICSILICSDLFCSDMIFINFIHIQSNLGYNSIH